MKKFKEKKTWQKVLTIIITIIIILVAAFAAVFVAAIITEYKPADVEKVEVVGKADATLGKGDTFNIVSWNIGYAGLSNNADFFMDGGSKSMSCDAKKINENMQGIEGTVVEKKPEIIFFQEVDKCSFRTFGLDEQAELAKYFQGMCYTYAYNHKSIFVPTGFPPIGTVNAGLMILSNYQVTDAQRNQLFSADSWPVSAFNLKRCFLINRIPVANTDKELVLIDLHLDAYGDEENRAVQTIELFEFMNAEYDKGNYVIAGGDFNQRFPGYDSGLLLDENYWNPCEISYEGMGDNLIVATNNNAPSCRSLDKAYEGADHSNFQSYNIDGFIVSDNVKVNDVSIIDADFQYSDHNPVYMNVTLK